MDNVLTVLKAMNYFVVWMCEIFYFFVKKIDIYFLKISHNKILKTI